MLSKDEILKKKGKSPEQLDLVRDLDIDKNKTKNRLLLLLFLILFVGSSIGLSLYRQYKEGKLILNFSIPNLPKFSQPVTTDKNIWEICLFDKNSKSLLYSQNCKNSEISISTVTNSIDLIKSSLPNGLVINENISTSSSEINYISEISSPKFSLLLTIKILGSYSLENSQKLIPKLANDLYWRWSR